MTMHDLKLFTRARSTAVEIVELAALARNLIERRKPGKRLSRRAKDRLTCHLRGAARAFGRGLCNLRFSRLKGAEYLLASEGVLRRAEFESAHK